MPKFLENKLRAEYGNNPRAIYGTMNKLGAMHGSKETAKGREMERKHEADMKKESHSIRRIEIHPADNGGHTVETHFHPTKSKSPAFDSYQEPKKAVFGADEHEKMISHVKGHLGLGSKSKAESEEEGEEE